MCVYRLFATSDAGCKWRLKREGFYDGKETQTQGGNQWGWGVDKESRREILEIDRCSCLDAAAVAVAAAAEERHSQNKRCCVGGLPVCGANSGHSCSYVVVNYIYDLTGYIFAVVMMVA